MFNILNLTEIVVRAGDQEHDLQRKVRLATILGTFQSTLTDFPYLRKIWKQNTEEERLLGVSLTGQLDNEKFFTRQFDLAELRNLAITINSEFANLLGINCSTAITCVKPSGTVSQLVDSSSGLHGRYSPYYIRTVRADNKDPLTQFMKDAGIPWEPERNKPDQTVVFSFPIKSPEGSVMANDLSAIEQLEYWKYLQEEWCEHKPSATIYVSEAEWPEVGGWVYKNFDIVSGVSFLPRDNMVYEQAPYQPVSEEEYHNLLKKMPKEIRWEDLSYYELEDMTSGMQTLSCSADSCEVVDLT